MKWVLALCSLEISGFRPSANGVHFISSRFSSRSRPRQPREHAPHLQRPLRQGRRAAPTSASRSPPSRAASAPAARRSRRSPARSTSSRAASSASLSAPRSSRTPSTPSSRTSARTRASRVRGPSTAAGSAAAACRPYRYDAPLRTSGIKNQGRVSKEGVRRIQTRCTDRPGGLSACPAVPTWVGGGDHPDIRIPHKVSK